MHSKASFATILLSNAAKYSKIAGFLRVLGGRAHACARARASEKLRAVSFGTRRVPYHEAPVSASGKDLPQGQVARVDPT